MSTVRVQPSVLLCELLECIIANKFISGADRQNMLHRILAKQNSIFLIAVNKLLCRYNLQCRYRLLIVLILSLNSTGGDVSRLPLNIDGVDQWSSITLNTPSRRDTVLINIDENARNAAIRKDSWKLIIGRFRFLIIKVYLPIIYSAKRLLVDVN